MGEEDAENRLDGSISVVSPEGNSQKRKKKLVVFGKEFRDKSLLWRTLALFLGDPTKSRLKQHSKYWILFVTEENESQPLIFR